MKLDWKFTGLIFGSAFLLLSFTESLAQAAPRAAYPVKRIFLAEIKDEMLSRKGAVEDLFRKKLARAGLATAADAGKADAVLSIAVQRRTTLMADDNITIEIHIFKLTGRNGKLLWESQKIIKDHQLLEAIADDLVKTLKNSGKKRQIKNRKKSA